MIKNGKKPLSQKPGASSLVDEGFGDNLAIPESLKAELDAKGLAWRFIDVKKLSDGGGYHPKGWVPYKRDRNAIIADSTEFKFGSDPDGYIRRGTVVLAVKSKEAAEKHRAFLKHRADTYKQVNKQKAQELKQMAGSLGAGVEVHEGYDENE